MRQDEVLVDLITNKDVEPAVLEEGRLSFQKWEQEKSAANQRAAVPSVVIRGPKEAGEGARDKVRVARVERQEGRPAGPRFGSLVHAVLERVALTAGADEVSELVWQQGRVFGASDEECLACEVAVVRALEHPVMERARGAEICLRESPLSFRQEDGGLVSGVIDLAYRVDGVWTVVDFKTDEVLREYLRQVGVYVWGVEGVTGCEGEGWVLLV